ncbi:MAG: ribonuclease HI family protein [Solirubrobacteraceae bacterium]
MSASAPGRRRVTIHVDGGARGNPGPAAIGVVASDPDDGEVLAELAERIGAATNNVAEYTALLRGIELAVALGAREVDLINDSELVARQLTGAYRVKHPAMRRLYERAIAALDGFDRWSIRSVPRARNARADALVNRALDGG